MTTLITVLLLVIIARALTRYARHDALAAAPRPRYERRDELDRLRPRCVHG